MAKAKAKTKKKSNILRENAVVNYLRDTRAELRKVHWPSREEAWGLTQIVLLVTVSAALFLGLLDYLFAREMKGLISGSPIAIGIVVVFAIAGVLVALILGRQTA